MRARDLMSPNPVTVHVESSLEEALELAQRHNPAYRATQNDRAVADWGVKLSLALLALIPFRIIVTKFTARVA